MKRVAWCAALLGLALGAAGAPAAAQEDLGSVSPARQLSITHHDVVHMRHQLSVVLGLLEQARKDKDVLKLNCINDKLTNVKGLVKVSEQSATDLRVAIAQQDKDAAETAFRKVEVARHRVDGLTADAEQCIGQLAYYTSENTVVTVTEPKDLPKNDPSRPPAPEPIVFLPPAASPTQ